MWKKILFVILTLLEHRSYPFPHSHKTVIVKETKRDMAFTTLHATAKLLHTDIYRDIFAL